MSDSKRNRSSTAKAKQSPAPSPVPPLKSNGKADDPWSLDRLRAKQDFRVLIGAERTYASIPVGRPNPQRWYRCRAGEDWRLPVYLLNLREENELYIVPDAKVQAVLQDEVKRYVVFLLVSKQGDPLLWPVRTPEENEKDNDAWQSARHAAELMEEAWCRVRWSHTAKKYDVTRAKPSLPFPEPTWPNFEFPEALRLGFERYRIDDLSHPACRELGY